MSWVPFAVFSIVAYGVWGLVSKLALEHTNWAQTSLLFGVGVIAVSLVGLTFTGGDWTPQGLRLSAAAGLMGAVGLGVFYIALSRGPASQVVPAIGIYPAITTVLALLFLTERLSLVQAGGVLLAVAGVALVGLGG